MALGDTAVYNIRITGDSQEQAGNPAEPSQSGELNASDPTKPKKGQTKSTTVAVGMYLGKQAVGFMSSNVEAYTRNAQAQEQVNNVMKGIGYAAAIMANPYLGIAMIAVDVATQALENSRKVKESNRVAEQYRQRSGNINRSR